MCVFFGFFFFVLEIRFVFVRFTVENGIFEIGAGGGVYREFEVCGIFYTRKIGGVCCGGVYVCV